MNGLSVTRICFPINFALRHIDFPPGMKCKLVSKVGFYYNASVSVFNHTECGKSVKMALSLSQLEEESLHCVCEGDLCNEDFIPGSGHNFFNYSTKV